MADTTAVASNDRRRGCLALIPYGRHQITPCDIAAVSETLSSDWLTTGPKVAEFEATFARYAGVKHAVAVSSGTSALHCAMHAIGIKPGDEVIVPAITFAATANCVIMQGARPVIADVDPQTLLIDPKSIETRITSRTKAVIAVEYAGQPCDYKSLRNLTHQHQLFLISDSCHALGAEYEGEPIARLADLTVFSFHPVKHITTGEGGAIVTNDKAMDARMRRFRNHGISADLHQRGSAGTWYYEVRELGFNYRITDFQCALGLSQLKKADQWLRGRRKIAHQYDQAFKAINAVQPLKVKQNVRHAYHLYVVKVEDRKDGFDRAKIFSALREKGIGVNVHYIPLNLHPFYQQHHGARKGQCPAAESAYENIISLPLFPAMRDRDVIFIIESIQKLVQ